MKTIDWYFDFISPFAYLVSESLDRLPASVTVRPRPVLFAGMLNHWDTRGPAEIPPMRRYTFRYIRYLADRDGIDLLLPPRHPFNPLKLLRLAIALGEKPAVVRRLFRFVWAEGRDLDDPEDWRDLATALGIDDPDSLVTDPAVKARLRDNTAGAIDRGVFGVPTFIVDEEIFWGYDSLDFLRACLIDPKLLQSPGMRAVDAMAEGSHRKP